MYTAGDTIAAVLRSGGDYTAEHALNLRRMVAQHLQKPHRFVLLTDVNIRWDQHDILALPLRCGWPGWWSKIELFRDLPGALYFDLDTAIVDGIDDLLVDAPGMWMLDDFLSPGKPASGVMRWSGDYRFLFDTFAAQPLGWQKLCRTPRYWGDQGFVERVLHDRGHPWFSLQATHPRVFASYKGHVKSRGSVPPGCSVVCFHGQPRPWAAGVLPGLYPERASGKPSAGDANAPAPRVPY